MTSAAHPAPPVPCAINRTVAYIHVADVDASLAFYALLGYAPEKTLKDEQGRAFWSLAHSGTAEIMLARASGPIDAAQQAVLFYMYSADVAGLRRHLLASGLHAGGIYRGAAGPNGGRREVFEIARPDYMPAGEVRIADPDGYIILVGQLN
ncbi:MAG: hypothetical protein Q8L55_13885 [Phycisphaerales bacterium]|nr:hypothetical protein [Phycisphaerales bacterium]